MTGLLGTWAVVSPSCAREPKTRPSQEAIIDKCAQAGKSVAESLLEDPRTASGVGAATIFVSWYLAAMLESDLFDALEAYMERERLDPADTFFWVCDYVIRLGGVDKTTPDLFTTVILDIGHTLVRARAASIFFL